MEGLIPMVYRSLKKSKTRARYECLSSGTTAQTYNISDFYTDGYNHKYVVSTPPAPQAKVSDYGHRRHKSFTDYSGGGGGGGGGFMAAEDTDVKSKKLVRFRSHRMFSCVTGA